MTWCNRPATVADSCFLADHPAGSTRPGAPADPMGRKESKFKTADLRGSKVVVHQSRRGLLGPVGGPDGAHADPNVEPPDTVGCKLQRRLHVSAVSTLRGPEPALGRSQPRALHPSRGVAQRPWRVGSAGPRLEHGLQSSAGID